MAIITLSLALSHGGYPNPNIFCGPSIWSTTTLHQAWGPIKCKIRIFFPMVRPLGNFQGLLDFMVMALGLHKKWLLWRRKFNCDYAKCHTASMSIMGHRERWGIGINDQADFLFVRLRHFPNQGCVRIQRGTGEGEATARIEREMSGKEMKLPSPQGFSQLRMWVILEINHGYHPNAKSLLLTAPHNIDLSLKLANGQWSQSLEIASYATLFLQCGWKVHILCWSVPSTTP